MQKNILVPLVLIMLVFSQCITREKGIIMTVNGPVSPEKTGITLTHEHILVDFIGADSVNYGRWDRSEVIERSTPFLKQIKDFGCNTFIECTPEYIGRDPLLLKTLSSLLGINILTNTGYYGAANNKYIPQHAYSETAEQLASRWKGEWENGIEDTGIKPGFIKIGVAGGTLSDLHRKLVTAAARTHLETGLTIASHTGPALPAFEELDIIQKEGVAPEAFIWVHAQNEKDIGKHVLAAKMGAWVSFDGINNNNIDDYTELITNMKNNNLLGRVLLSHDAGWYSPGEENGGSYRGYTALFEKLLPALKEEQFTDEEINQMLVANPAEAFQIRIRRK